MTNLIFTHDDCRYHGDKRPREAADDTPPPGGYTHPEQPPRLRAVLDGLSASPALAAIERKDAAEADPARLKTLHGSAYVDAMLRPVAEGEIDWFDADTARTAGSPRAALLAAGGAIEAAERVMNGAANRVFVAARPPGHHAETNKAVGFCFFGNVALAAERALELGASKVAVLDFDVHHGNGTQALLWDNPDCLVVTSQQMPLWPGTGTVEERGAHDNV